MSDCTKPTVLNRAVMVLQKAITAVLMIAQLIYASIKDRAGSMEMSKTKQTINVAAAAVEWTEQAVNVAAAADEQTGQETMVAAATTTGREQTEMDRTSRQTQQAGQVASVAAAASIHREQDRRGPAAAAGDRRLRQRAVSSGCKRSSRPALTAVAITMSVLSMMMVTKAGAQAVEMASSDGGGYRYGWAEHEDGYGSCGDTIMPRVELYDIKVQKWQKVERNRVQRFEAKNNDDFVTN